MNSDEGKEFLEKSNQNLVNSNETEVQNVVENEGVNETVDTTDDLTLDTEDSYSYYDAQKSMKDKFDTQKKK